MRSTARIVIVVCLAGIACACADGSGGETTYPTAVYLPPDYDPSESWPMILFLHGAFGGTAGGALQGAVMGYANDHPDFPFIVVAPISEEPWSPPLLADTVEQAKADYNIDDSRVYLTGMSDGAEASWKLAVLVPGMFAAMATISGGGDPDRLDLCSISHLPVWAFHNENDPVIPLGQTQAMVDALLACGGNVTLTVYDSSQHDAWTQTYADPQLYAWFLAQ